MRLALLLIVLLTLTGQARADVFVPADPPALPGARCAAAAGDVVAANTSDSLVVSIAGAPWQAISGLSGCPILSATSDGTAAIVAANSDRGGAALVIRPPGGAFGAPIELGVSAEAPSVAVGSGGWAVVTSQGLEDDNGLTAIVIRPDRTTARAVLDRVGGSARTRQFFGRAEAAIDASGNATIVWAHYTGSRVRLRTAQAIAGGSPVLGADLPGTSPEEGAFAVAVAPAGQRLLTWATTDGLVATVDGQAPQTLDATTAVSTLAASIADDGAAAIVYSSAGREIVAVDRAAGGAWAIPHVLGPPPQRRDGDDYSSSSDDSPAPLVTVAPGAQALAAWRVRRGDVLGVAGAVGQPGGAWAPAAALSSITRDAFPAGIARSPTRGPGVYWLESGRGVFGAVLAPAPTDTAPPSVTATFPRRVAPTRTGRIALTVRVRCSEACDARLAAATGEIRGGRVVRATVPGRAATLRLPSAPEFERELLFHPRSRKVRIELLVTDRAGNVQRQTRTIRVRVIERPLLSLRVAANRRFGMSSAAGDRAVARLVNELITRAAARRNGDDDALNRRFRRGIVAIRRAGHKEVDSENVRRSIYRALELPLTRAGYDIDDVTST